MTRGRGADESTICPRLTASTTIRSRVSNPKFHPSIERSDARAAAAQTIEHDPEAVAAWLDEVANDPVRFVEEAFAWGQGELQGSTRSGALAAVVARANSRRFADAGRGDQNRDCLGHGIGQVRCVCVTDAVGDFNFSRHSRHRHSISLNRC